MFLEQQISIPAYEKLVCTMVNVHYFTLKHGMLLNIYTSSNQTMQKQQMINNQSLLMRYS